MKVHQLLDHYGITENPFAQEDAASDRVFLEHCLTGTHHSAWDKIYGDPRAPATSVVFGEQGSGKTALRLQIESKLQEHNLAHPDAGLHRRVRRLQPVLDSFRERLGSRQRKQDKALQNWRLWDHMDAILTLATTRLADAIRNEFQQTDKAQASMPGDSRTSRPQKRDILLLAACYDHNRESSPAQRWGALRKACDSRTWKTWWDSWWGAW